MEEHLKDLVLIVEDSKSIRLALKPGLERVCGVEVLMADTFTEAVKIIEAYGPRLFLAILDLALPDAMQGEIVDYAAARAVPSLVFTSTFDAKLRETILSKGVIDYVVKSSRSVEELVHIVRRLQLNRQVRLLVVDDSRSARLGIQSSLALHMFQVFTAKSGQEALEVLEREGHVDLVLTDYEMPGMDGLELTARIRNSFSKEEQVVLGVSSAEDDSLPAKFLKSGANDFMRKPFGREEFYCRVLHHVEALEQTRRLRVWTQKLAESEERERHIIEHAPIGIFRSTPQGRYLSANARLAEMYGYESPQDLIASVQDIARQMYVTPSDREMVQKAVEQGPIERMEVLRRCKDGSRIWVALSMLAVKDEDGRIVYYEGFARDVTKRKQAEDALMDKEYFLRLVLDSVDAGVLVIDPQSHRVESVNTAAANMFGAPAEDILGQVCHKFLCPAEVGRCPITDLGQAVEHSERVLLQANGGSVHILKSAKRFVLNGVEKLLETFVDISERKNAEAIRDQIERIIRHDLRTPVSSALYTAQLLRDSENMTVDQRQLLDALEATARQMSDMLNSSLELYKMETGQYTFQPQAIDCVGFLRTLAQTVTKAPQFQDARLELLIDGLPVTTDSRCVCLGQHNLLRTALQNILKNALEASPSGAPVIVDLSSRKGCRIEMSNVGAVPPEIRDRFFDKYVTSGKYKGTGLGTYSARLMVKAQGGDITMRTSDEDNRTVVTVTLPSG